MQIGEILILMSPRDVFCDHIALSFVKWVTTVIELDLDFCVFSACSSVILVGRQIRHHKTSRHYPPSSSIPPPLFRLLQQGPQTLWRLQLRQPVLSITAAFSHSHPLAILSVYSGIVPSQSSSRPSSSSPSLGFLSILCLLLPPCPCPTSTIRV